MFNIPCLPSPVGAPGFDTENAIRSQACFSTIILPETVNFAQGRSLVSLLCISLVEKSLYTRFFIYK